MNSEEVRSLILYFMVDDKFRQQNVGTAMLKMIMSHKEYHDRKVIFVTHLNKKYGYVIALDMYDPFLNKFKFEGNEKKGSTRKETMMLTV